jgi:hypothetical protein
VEREGEVFLGNEKRENQPACGKVLLDYANLLSVLAEDSVRIGYRPGFLVDNEGVSLKKWVHVFVLFMMLVFVLILIAILVIILHKTIKNVTKNKNFFAEPPAKKNP